MELDELIMLGACSMITLKKPIVQGYPQSGYAIATAWEIEDAVKTAKAVWREVCRTRKEE